MLLCGHGRYDIREVCIPILANSLESKHLFYWQLKFENIILSRNIKVESKLFCSDNGFMPPLFLAIIC
jgi:hypothetical protein